MTHVNPKKIQEVMQLKELMKKYRVISVADLTSLPSSNLQSIRNKLREKIEIKVTKKRLIIRAIDELKEKDLTLLKPYLEKSIPALIFSNEEPFKLFKLIKENRTNAPAKPGQLAPIDLTISSGPTPFTPGPFIGELGAIGLQTSVEQGKVVIKKDKLIAKQGEIIKPEVASVLVKLGIEPIEISFNILAVYDKGILYEKSVLDVSQEDYINKIKLAYAQATTLAEEIGYISKDNIELMLTKGYKDALALSRELKIEASKEILKKEIEEVKEIKAKEEVQEEEDKKGEGFVGYSKEVEEKAQSILRELQDKKIQEQEKPKHKSMWD
ncbi:MAG: 50S ribosomal protein L10 [Nanoarchaeota archaeon]